MISFKCVLYILRPPTGKLISSKCAPLGAFFATRNNNNDVNLVGNVW